MFKIRNKILVVFLSVIIIPIVIISAFFTLYTTKTLKQNKIEELQHAQNIKVEKAISFVRAIDADIRSFANNTLLLNYIDALEKEDIEQINRRKFELELFFKTFAESRNIYDQIRYIDNIGLEKVRVDLLYKDYADIVPPEELQDKSNSYYFKEAVKLNEGEFNVSKLDLNREHGEIECPYKPMLRYVTPVFDRGKRYRGVLVLNVLADYLLKNILTHRYLTGVDSYLLDKDGFYLLHPEMSKRWGGPGDLNTGENIKSNLPQEIVSLIMSGQSGSKLANEHYFNFTTIKFDPLDDARYWIFMERIDKSIILASIYSFYKVFGVLALLLIAGVVTATLIFSKKLTRPLDDLVKGAAAVAKGDLDYHITVRTNDEIALLASSFNKMIFQLGKSRRGQQSYALNLEQTVEDKTEEVKEGKEYVGNLIENAQDAIISIDEKGIVNIWNKSAERIFGYSESEITGQPITPIIPERYSEQHEKGLRRFLRIRSRRIIGKTIEVFGITKEGIEIPIEMSLAFQKLSFQKNKKARYSFTAIIRDITERKKSERHLNAQYAVTHILSVSTTLKEASNKILKVICESLRWEFGVMWLYNRQDDVLRCSELWHVPNIEVSEFKEMTRENSFASEIGLPGRVWESGKPAWIVDVVQDSNFPRASVALKAGLHGAFGFPIIINEEVLGILEFFSQKTEEPDKNLLEMMTAIGRQIGLFIKRKQAEEALLRSEKLKSIGTITSGVAHEFNNILAIISGNVQLLEASYQDHEELTEALRTIKRATNDGAQISRRMLKFSKTAQDTAGFVLFDINELINQAIDFTLPRWKNMAQAKGVNYHMDTEGMKRVPSILCNPTELREVVVNIINNALDAMPDDGRITFRTWSGEDIVFISISDTGEGMSEEVKKNIFDPFFTTKTAVGTGLGMSLAYGIVTGHGGKIEVESEVGKGSTFNLQFSAVAKADSPKESPEPEQEIMNKCLRILVVDDEKDICNILDKFFSMKGHLVRVVDNGREAIILAKEADYDLVLCDMAMPEVYGYDVIRALNKLEKRPKIGIITGWGEKLKPIDGEDVKVDFIIKKPFDFSELAKHINDVFGSDSR